MTVCTRGRMAKPTKIRTVSAAAMAGSQRISCSLGFSLLRALRLAVRAIPAKVSTMTTAVIRASGFSAVDADQDREP